MMAMLDPRDQALLAACPVVAAPRFGKLPEMANGQRIIAVHVKDLAPAGQNQDEGGWADAGHGTIDWKSLWPTIRSKTRASYFIAEHDNPNDIDRFASRAIATIKALGA